MPEIMNDCLQNKTSFFWRLFCYRKILQIKTSAIQGVHFKITYDTQIQAILPPLIWRHRNTPREDRVTD